MAHRDLGRDERGAGGAAFGDGVSAVRFCAVGAGEGRDDDDDGMARRLTLLVTSWDGTARRYACRAREIGDVKSLNSIDLGAPALCGTFVGTDEDAACVGCLDGSVRFVDFKTGAFRVVGAHDDGAVSAVEYDDATKKLFTFGWDRTIRAWDLTKDERGRAVSTTKTAGKCYAADLRDGKIFVATSDGQVLAYETRDLVRGVDGDDGRRASEAPPRPLINRRSSLRFQTRAIAANIRGVGFVAASVEGRVAVEFIRDEENDKRKYAFKCHRKTDDASVGEIVYPVHAVAFHPVHGTFATGGGDGYVNFWDGDAKKRLFQSPRYPTSISALAFSPCGSLLAIASSYAHEERENNKPEDRVFLRETRAEEVTPKSAKTS